jgi:hypothetical protein
MRDTNLFRVALWGTIDYKQNCLSQQPHHHTPYILSPLHFLIGSVRKDALFVRTTPLIFLFFPTVRLASMLQVPYV